MFRAPARGALAMAALLAPIVSHGQEMGPPPTGTGLILGQVVDAQTNNPIPSASVTLSGNASAASSAAGNAGLQPAPFVQPRRAFADAQGRFAFPALPAGSFLLSASAAGYQPGVLNQGQPGGPLFP